MKIFTIGHSNLEFDRFIDILKSFNIKKLIDVRSMPGSRYVPQFNIEVISVALEKSNIAYMHFSKLGGRRKSLSTTDQQLVNGWKNSSFRNYAAYTMTQDYEDGIRDLTNEAKKGTTCIMCAESVPWRCHRLLISNTLISRGVPVFHIMGVKKCISHQLNLYGAYAEVDNEKVIYPQKNVSFSQRQTSQDGPVL